MRSIPFTKTVSITVIIIILFAAFSYAYEVPGGIADWRYSRATGLPGTLSIPIGKTPEEAVQKFRSVLMQVVHKESVDGGVLLFLKRLGQKEDHTDLQVEFVHKTWLGWKWVMGGGYGISSGPNSNEALNYMSMPKYKGIKGPFPIVFGEISNPIITNVAVSNEGDNAGTFNAKLIEYGGGKKLWYVVLPSSTDAPYEIEALNGEGEKVVKNSLDDSRGVTSVLMSK